MSQVQIKAILNDSTIGIQRNETDTITTAGDAIDYRVLGIGTSEEEITLSTEIGNAGYFFVRNMDDENFVDLGFATTVYPIRLLAGHFALIPLTPATASVFAKADTAECSVEFYFHEA